MAITVQWRNAVVLALVTVASACAIQAKKEVASSTDSAAISAAVDSPDRPNADRALDAARKPREMLAFFGIRPGMRILDLFSGAGWYAELEARVVGPTGEAESQILRNPDDDRTKAFFDPEMKGKNTDKFALLFRKP